jgi:YgiT-type zinc finger domain-containing protein
MIRCEECRVGRYCEGLAPFTAWFESQMVVVPDVPALVCDACGDIVYDPDFVRHLQLLLEDDARRAHSQNPEQRTFTLYDEQSWQRLRRSM